MNNTTRRRVAALTVALVGLTVAALVSSHHTSTEVVTGDDTTTSGAATSSTTAVPETTTAESTTTTVAPATTVVETTVPPPTTVVTEPPTSAPASPPPATAKAGLSTQEDTGIQPVGAGDPAPAVRAGTKCMASDPAECNPPTTPARVAWRYCEEWHELAAEVGWPEDAGPTLSYIIHRESGCDPNARNRSSGAAGLTQLLGHNCGGSCFDPANNLRTALALYNGRHWCDWYLRGDPVTGHACG